jgi:DNA-binding CsgD family transcriptional regulator
MSAVINSKYFKSVLEFNETHSHRLDQICSPLKNAFGIKHFGQGQVFDNGKYFLVSNSPVFIKAIACYDFQFKTKFFSKITPFICKTEPLQIIWPEITDDEGIMYVRENNVKNGYSVIKESKGSLHYYFFAMENSQNDDLQFLREHSGVFDKFIDHFYRVSSDICKPEIGLNMGTSPHLKKIFPRVENAFLPTTPWQRKVQYFSSLLKSNLSNEVEELRRKYNLTDRQLEVLSHYSTGKTAKEVAILLNIGNRTVEDHLDILRRRTKCQSKSELIHWFKETFEPLLRNVF